MLAGHFTTALIAKQRVPRGAIAYFLVASQLPDLLWLTFHFLGLEPTQPDNLMLVSLDSLEVEMTYSHDLLPMLGWIALTVLAGRVWFGGWRSGLAGGVLVAVHALTDYVGGFPHNVFGPDTHAVGTGMYLTSPYLAVTLEAIFIVVTMLWVVDADRGAGIRRSASTWRAWIAVFGGGTAFMFSSADLSMVELTGVEPLDAMSGMAIPTMVVFYLAMMSALAWAESRPTRSTVG